jgi:antitoxin CptB
MNDASLDGLPEDQALSSAALSKLRWRCRRGLLENDLFIERFFNRHAATLTVGQARGLYELMALSDNALLDVLLGRSEPPPSAHPTQLNAVLRLLKP